MVTVLATLAVPALAQAGYGPPEIVSSPGSDASVPVLVGATADLSATYFLTAEGIDPADTDGVLDVYRRTASGIEIVTTGTTQPVTDARLSADGAWLGWQSAGAPVPGQGDGDAGMEDVYRTHLGSGATAWISQGGNSPMYGSALRGVADNGAVFLTTAENLSAADADTGGGADAYVGTGAGAPTLLSGATSSASVTVERIARDGSAAIIRTPDALAAADADTAVDLYRTDGSLTIVSDDGNNPDPNTPAGFVAAASDNLDVVYFYTAEPLDPSGLDAGGTDDVYRWAGAAPVLATGTGTSAVQSGIGSADGLRFWFHTSSSLVAGDSNGSGADVYEFRGATSSLHLVSSGSGFGAILHGVAGDRVFFSSPDDYGDGDPGDDVYEHNAGITTLRTPGTPASVSWAGVSADGARVFYETLDPLVAGDADPARDVYTTEGGGPELVSHGGDGSGGVQFARADGSGAGVLLESHEALVAADTDVNVRDWFLARSGAAAAPPAPAAGPGTGSGVAPTAGPAPGAPVPVEGKLFNAAPVTGTVLVRVPGGRAFARLSELESIPSGSVVDARRGRVRLFTTDGRGGVQSSDFYGGMFRVTQRLGGLVELALAGGSFKDCSPPKAARRAAAAVGKSVRRLWGSGKGRFRTKGRFAAATVRGTTWLTDDRCDGTLVRVTEGAVVARDLVRRRSVLLRAKRQYFAAATKAGAAKRSRRR